MKQQIKWWRHCWILTQVSGVFLHSRIQKPRTLFKVSEYIFVKQRKPCIHSMYNHWRVLLKGFEIIYLGICMILEMWFLASFTIWVISLCMILIQLYFHKATHDYMSMSILTADALSPPLAIISSCKCLIVHYLKAMSAYFFQLLKGLQSP